MSFIPVLDILLDDNKTIFQPYESTEYNFVDYIDEKGINLYVVDEPIAELNGHTLREVFENTSLFDNYQLVSNGDFSDGLSGWSAGASSITESDNILTNTTNGTASYGTAYQLRPILLNDYYIIGKLRSLNINTTTFQIQFGNGVISQSTPIQNSWYLLSKIFTSTYNENRNFTIIHSYIDNATASGKQIEVDYAYAFNITALKALQLYSPLYNDTFDLMTDEQIKIQMDDFVQKPYLFIDYQSLGIDNLTTEQMDYYYSLYQENQMSLSNDAVSSARVFYNDRTIQSDSVLDLEYSRARMSKYTNTSLDCEADVNCYNVSELGKVMWRDGVLGTIPYKDDYGNFQWPIFDSLYTLAKESLTFVLGKTREFVRSFLPSWMVPDETLEGVLSPNTEDYSNYLNDEDYYTYNYYTHMYEQKRLGSNYFYLEFYNYDDELMTLYYIGDTYYVVSGDQSSIIADLIRYGVAYVENIVSDIYLQQLFTDLGYLIE